ncbi:MAG: monovalent cation/H+ antiporter complex subunit F [Candidatus Aerophobetes bacterium]|nr:monovalent cation/H+ antiporter complex subunit F [Candidatus Aerophobetes bacterium]
MGVNILTIVILLLLINSLVSVYRVIIGPTHQDRLIGLNLILSQVTVIMVVAAVNFHRTIYLDVALVYAILSYISIIAITKYFKRRRLRK